MPPGHNLQPLPFYILKSTMLNKMAISKYWSDVFGEMVGMEGVLVAFQSLEKNNK